MTEEPSPEGRGSSETKSGRYAPHTMQTSPSLIKAALCPRLILYHLRRIHNEAPRRWSSETKSETNGRRSWLERGAACLRSSSFLFLRMVSQFAASTCVADIHSSLGNLHHEHSHSAGGTRSERIFAMLRSLHQHEQRAATL